MALLRTTTPPKAAARRGFGIKQLTLATLTFQNSILILIMHASRTMPTPSPHHRYFTSTAVLLTEFVKMSVSLTLAMYDTGKTLAPHTPVTVLFEQIYNAVFAGDGWKLAVPATFYTVQNLLSYVAVGNMEAVEYQVLSQLKILITALFSVLLLRRSLPPKKWIALITLTVGVSVVSIPTWSSSSSTSSSGGGGHLIWGHVPDHVFPRSLLELGQGSSPEAAEGGAHLAKRSATYQGIDNDLLMSSDPSALMNHSLGVTATLLTAVLSGLTGVYFEKLLKESPNQVSVWIRNIQLSFYSIAITVVMGILYQDGEGIKKWGFFEGWNWTVWAAVGLQSLGGMVGSVVIRDGDSIVKCFATSIGIVVSFGGSVWLFDFHVTSTFILGTALVLFATYLYSTSPSGPTRFAHRPPPITIASFEKPTIISALTPRATPRLMDDKKLNLDPLDASSQPVRLSAVDHRLGVTSSRPNSPMLPRANSKTNLKRDE